MMDGPAPNLPLTILSFLLVIGILVFIHELGHYLAGRWFGVKAEAFSIGFGREVAGWTDKRGTRWKVGWLPLGGYVRFKGDMSPASKPDPEWLRMPPEERSQCFQAKPLWQRAIIVAAGPIINFAFALLIFAAFFAAYGEYRTSTTLGEVQGPAAAAGLRPGDTVKAIAGREVDDFDDVRRFVILRPGQRVDVLAERGGETLLLPVTIGTRWEEDRFGNRYAMGQMGVRPDGYRQVPLSLTDIPGAALSRFGDTIELMTDSIAQIVTGRRSAKELGGPLRIAQVSGEQAMGGWQNLLLFMALISINLGFINLLPVPMLDGGHLAFYAVAGIRGRAPNPKTVERAFRGGLAVLLALMVMVTLNDLAAFGLFSGLAGLIG